jgi:uncharacterized membrane protein YeaQ/YmgE (transglycosylase-associated protein family)
MNTFSETTRRNIFAVAVGPLALVPAIILATLLNVLFQGSDSDWQGAIVSALFVSVVGLLIAYPLVVVLGVPAVLVLRRYQTLGFFPLAILGLVGALAVTLWLAPSVQSFLMFGYCSTAVVSGCWCAYKYAKL